MPMWIVSRGGVLLILLGLGYRVLIDLILHRSAINNSASLSNKFGEFYFIFKFGISGLLHQVVTAIADRIRGWGGSYPIMHTTMVPEQVETKKIQAGVQVSRLEDKDEISIDGTDCVWDSLLQVKVCFRYNPIEGWKTLIEDSGVMFSNRIWAYESIKPTKETTTMGKMSRVQNLCVYFSEFVIPKIEDGEKKIENHSIDIQDRLSRYHMTPVLIYAELLRENKRMIDKCIREIERERQGLQTQETKLIVGIKKVAKRGQMILKCTLFSSRALLRSWLKTLSDHNTRLRSSTTLKYQLQAVSLRIQCIGDETLSGRGEHQSLEESPKEENRAGTENNGGNDFVFSIKCPAVVVIVWKAPHLFWGQFQGSSSVLPFYERAHELPTTRSPALGIDFSSFVTQHEQKQVLYRVGWLLITIDIAKQRFVLSLSSSDAPFETESETWTFHICGLLDRTVITYEAELFAELTDKKDANISEIGIETRPNLKYYGGAASEDVCFLHDLAYIPESQANCRGVTKHHLLEHLLHI
ncbi:hypothetical protein Tco_1571391 [Tanacetum coccineum]